MPGEQALYIRKGRAGGANGRVAAAASPQARRAEALLDKAAELAPGLLAVDVARYQFYFYRGELPAAERVVRDTLVKAAAQGGFSPVWERHTAPLPRREQADSPARHYLHALKALALVRLRSGAPQEAETILQALATLDPDDRAAAGQAG